MNSSIRNVQPFHFFSVLFLMIGFLGASPSVTAQLAAPPPPEVAARSYILMDYASGNVLAGNKTDERMEPASLTKIMTSYIVSKELKAGHIKLTDMVRISERAWRMEGSRSFVEVGKQIPLEVLLKGMIVQSGNDATLALAEFVGGGEEVFVSMMNQQAKALGMTGTHYVNSTGLPHPDHYTTARDQAILARALIRDFPEDYAWYAVKEFTYNGITQRNRNLLLWRNQGVDGIKTGHTESAGYCLVAAAKQGEMRLIAVVLGTDSEKARAQETEKVLGYGFRFFETHRLYTAMQSLTTVRIWKGASENLPLGVQRDIFVTVPRGKYNELKAEMKVTNPIIAPAAKGQQFGTVNVSLQGNVLVSQPLVALAPVAEGGLLQRLYDDARLWMQ